MFVSDAENRQNIENIKRDVLITDYATKLGFALERVGKYYTIKEHDSIRIDADKNIFWRNSSGASGSIIDFIIEFEAGINNFHEAMKYLQSNYCSHSPTLNAQKTTKKQPKEKAKFTLPDRDKSMANVYAYLIQQRGLDKDIIGILINKGLIRQDLRKNCMFIGLNENNEAVFCNLRGTNTLAGYNFKGDVSGSDYDYGFYINNKSDTLYVTESPIDTISIMTLIKKQGLNPLDYNYLSLSGCSKSATLYKHLKSDFSGCKNIILAFDNDNAGHQLNEQTKANLLSMQKGYNVTTFPLPEEYKDINDFLLGIKNQEVAEEQEY